jgi:rubrerythrin
MGVKFNADEVLSIAEDIEANGVRFYESAASIVKEEKPRKLLLELADWERIHQKTFAEMRCALTDDQKKPLTFDPDNEAALFLQSLADASVIKTSISPLEQLGPSPACKDILAKAIGIEKESIVFYTGLRTLAADDSNRSRIDAILKEEMRHVVILQQEIAQRQ